MNEASLEGLEAKLGRAMGRAVTDFDMLEDGDRILVAVSGPFLPRFRQWPPAKSFLDGVNVASVALIAVVTGQLLLTALVDWLTVVLAIFSALVLLRFRANSAWLVLGGALIGWLASNWK